MPIFGSTQLAGPDERRRERTPDGGPRSQPRIAARTPWRSNTISTLSAWRPGCWTCTRRRCASTSGSAWSGRPARSAACVCTRATSWTVSGSSSTWSRRTGVNLAGVQRLLDIAEAVQRLRPLDAGEREPAGRPPARRAGNRADRPHGRALTVRTGRLRGAGGQRPRRRRASRMEFKDYYQTLGVTKSVVGERDQAGVPQARPQVSIPT